MPGKPKETEPPKAGVSAADKAAAAKEASNKAAAAKAKKAAEKAIATAAKAAEAAKKEAAKASAAKEASLAEDITYLKTTIQGLESKIGDLDHRFGRLEISAPAELRSLDFDTVKRAIVANPYAEFEVLVDWKKGTYRMNAGRKIRCDHYPQLLDYVGAGLRIGVPDNQDAVVAKYKAEAQERTESYRKEALARAEADAEAAKVKLAAMK